MASKGRGVAIWAVFALAMLVMTLLVGGHLVGTWFLRRELLAHGVRCDERLSVTLQFPPLRALVHETSCELSGPHGVRVELLEAVRVRVGARAPRALAVPSLRIHLRALPKGAPPANDDRVLGLLRVPERLSVLAHVLSELGTLPWTELSIGQLELSVSERALVVARGLTLRPGVPKGFTINEVSLPFVDAPLGSVVSARVENVRGSVEGDALSFEGHLWVSGEVPLLGELRRDEAIWVHAQGLSGAKPVVRFEH